MLTQKQSSKIINGVKTEVVLQPFADRILILITQLGKVGNLVRLGKPSTPKTATDMYTKIQASIPQTTPLLAQLSPDNEEPNASTLPPPPPSIQLTSLLGSAPTDHLRTLYALYASQVATIIWTAEANGLMDERRRSVVLGLALKRSEEEENEGLSEAERETFHQVMSMVKDLSLALLGRQTGPINVGLEAFKLLIPPDSILGPFPLDKRSESLLWGESGPRVVLRQVVGENASEYAQ